MEYVRIARVMAIGLFIGLAMAVPVGPIGVLCITRTIRFGRRAGLATGLGAASADATYGAIAALGLSLITSVLIDQTDLFLLVGGVALCAIGLRTMRRKHREMSAATGEAPSTGSFYLSSVLLTFSNPATIVSFLAIYAGMGLPENSSPGSSVALVASIFAGSSLWWIILSSVVEMVRERWFFGEKGTKGFRSLDLASGSVLIGFGVIALASGVL